jgi:hypothetical protein
MKKYLFHISIVLLLASCAKEKVTTPDLNVSTAALSYKVGDTVTFTLDGNPDNIVFYSGEPGRNYAFRTRTTANNDLQVQFKSLVQFGVIYQNLKVLVSNNYNGLADTNSVKNATWTDITNLAVLSTGADSVNSGVISLKPYYGAADTAKVYLAFKYTDYKKPQGQNRWVIRTFSADNISPEGAATNLAVMSTGGWQAVNFKNTTAVWSITTAQLLMSGGAATADDNEDWVISKGFSPKTILPDAGIALKNISNTLGSYKYVYTKPGTYKVVFEASAVRYNGEERTVKELTLNITP